MRSDKILEGALQPIGMPVKYQEYLGTKESYFVYNEEVETPVDYGDNKPQAAITWWQVHLFTPKQTEFRKTKEDAEKCLAEAGFTITNTVTLFETETKTIHVVINCHIEETEE